MVRDSSRDPGPSMQAPLLVPGASLPTTLILEKLQPHSALSSTPVLCLPSPPPSPATPYAAPGPTSGNPRAATNCLSADSSAGNLHSLPVKGPPPPQSPPSHQCRLLTEACVSPADPGSHGAFPGGYYVPLFLVWFSAVILYLGPFCMLWTYY